MRDGARAAAGGKKPIFPRTPILPHLGRRCPPETSGGPGQPGHRPLPLQEVPDAAKTGYTWAMIAAIEKNMRDDQSNEQQYLARKRSVLKKEMRLKKNVRFKRRKLSVF